MVAAIRGKLRILGREIGEFGIGLQACATGWQRPGKPLFLPGTGWNTTEGKGSFHARATPQNRAQKKEFPLRNADHKKGFAPRSEKSRLFLWGFTRGRWCPVDTVQHRPNRQVRLPQHCGESLPRTRAQSATKVPPIKKKWQASWSGRYGSSLPLYAGKLWAKKEPPLPLMGEYSPRGPAGGRFSNSGGFYCKGGMIYTVPLLPVCFPAFHQPFLHAALLKIPGKPPRPVIGCCFQHFLPQTQHNGLSP